MDLPAIVRRFEVEHVPIGGPVFDFAKLDWLNGRYLRERLDPESFARRAREWAHYAGTFDPDGGAGAAARRAA